MKKIILLLLCFTAGFAQDNPVNFKGTIRNATIDSVVVRSMSGKWRKALAIDDKGYFSGNVQRGANMFVFKAGEEEAMLWLENEYDLAITADAGSVVKTLQFEGIGAKENNFMLTMERDKTNLKEKYKDAVDAKELEKDANAIVDGWLAILKGFETSNLLRNKMYFDLKYHGKDLQEEISNAIVLKKLVNSKSPVFDYENHKGGKTKLEDLKGKYVYVDVWATWCGPCRQEIPYLQKIEEKYHGKKIEFVSISVDVAKDHDKWKKYVDTQNLGGIQLFADKDWKSDFIQAYVINSIPRFILIDPKGNVVEADAKRPSDPSLQEQLDKLLK